MIHPLTLTFNDKKIENQYVLARLALDIKFLAATACIALFIQIVFNIKDYLAVNNLQPLAKDIRLYFLTPALLIAVLTLFFSSEIKKNPSAFFVVSIITSFSLLFSQFAFAAINKNVLAYMAQGMTVILFSLCLFTGLRFYYLIVIFLPVTVVGFVYVLFFKMSLPYQTTVDTQIDFAIGLLLAGGACYVTEYRGRMLYLKQTQLMCQSEELVNENVFKETLLGILAHDIKGPMSRLNSVMHLINSNLVTPEESKALLQKLEKEYQDVDEMTDRLLTWVKAQFSGIVLKRISFSFYDLVNKNFQFFKDVANEKKINFNNDVPKLAKMDADADIINIVLRNIISNSLKFCRPGDKMNISFGSDDEYYHIYCHDNGPGFESGYVINSTLNGSVGTNNEKGFGLGLRICNDLLALHGSTLNIHSNSVLGSEISFKIPRK